jgi:hypothetical protein
MIERRAIYAGDQGATGPIVGAGFLVGAGFGGMAGGKAGAGAGAAIGGPLGAVVGAAVGGVMGLVGGAIVSSFSKKAPNHQVGWEEKWQDWEVVTGFDEDDPPTERKVGDEYLKIENC